MSLLWSNIWQIPTEKRKDLKIYKQFPVFLPFRPLSPLFTVSISTSLPGRLPLVNMDSCALAVLVEPFTNKQFCSSGTWLWQKDASLSSTALRTGHGKAQHWCHCLCLELSLITASSSKERSMVSFLQGSPCMGFHSKGNSIKSDEWLAENSTLTSPPWWKLEQWGHKYRGKQVMANVKSRLKWIYKNMVQNI